MMIKKRFILRCLNACLLSCLLGTLNAAKAAEFKYFDSDSVKLRYRVSGEGEPVLLIHGLGASIHLQWGAPGVIEALEKNYRVVAFDNRGHGRSGKPHDPALYGEEMMHDAVRLLDHLQIAKAHIVGYSMGAVITDKLLVEHPERFLTATLGGAGWVKPNDDRAEFLTEVADSLEQEKGIGPLLVKLTPEGRPKPTDDQLRMRVANKVFGFVNDQKALAAAARGMQRLAVTEEQLKQNRVPTLALVGGIDPLKITVDEMAEVMPNLTVAVIEDADHFTAFRSPQFLRELKGFLDSHAAAKTE
ncbi:MAG TPA: alpha/beta hydrolase [Pirellulales bacterium]|nr:alpha/beta hydrolase [Pirellulales bacterium]